MLAIAPACHAIPPAFAVLQTQAQHASYGGAAGQTVVGVGQNVDILNSTSSASALIGATTGAVPETTLSATAAYTTRGGNAPYAEATAELIYAVQINGPAGGTAKVNVDFSAKVCCAYGVTEAVAGYELLQVSPGANIVFQNPAGLVTNNQFLATSGHPGFVTVTNGSTFDWFDSNGNVFGGLSSGTSTPIQTGTSTFNQTITVNTGGYFVLGLWVDAEVDPTVQIFSGFPPPASITASIDPTFKIDASTPNASAYSIGYSAGIAAVPEPATAGLMGLGLASLLWRKRTASLAGARGS